jgi:hypothetical protein
LSSPTAGSAARTPTASAEFARKSRGCCRFSPVHQCAPGRTCAEGVRSATGACAYSSPKRSLANSPRRRPKSSGQHHQ